MTLEDLQKTVDEVKKFDVNIEYNLFDILGFSHYENMNSNILAYFLSSEKNHNYYPYFVESLLELIGKPMESIKHASVKVEREFLTKSGGRIDLVVTIDNDFVIGIENKIFHSIDNDLNDYKETLSSKNSNNSLVLLTIKEEQNSKVDKNITHRQLWDKVFEKIDFTQHISDKHLIILNEVRNNLNNLTEGVKMTQEEIGFLQNNKDQIRKIYELVANTEKEMKEIIQRIQVNEPENLFVRRGVVSIDNELYPAKDQIAYFDFEVEESTFAIDVVLDMTFKIRIIILDREKGAITDALEDKLKEQRIVTKKIKYDGCWRALIEWDFSIDQIAEINEKVAEIATKLKS